MTVVITNNRMMAKTEFPNLESVGNSYNALRLKTGTSVIIRRYGVGKINCEACATGDALIRAGTYREVSE